MGCTEFSGGTVKKDGALRLLRKDFSPQFRLGKLTGTPGFIEALDFLTPKTLPRVTEGFQICAGSA
jgi:hypothetical protein